MRTRITTDGSVWLIDEDAGRYCRMPKREGPRWSPDGEDWGGPKASPGLQDLVWHDCLHWELRDEFATTWSWGLEGEPMPLGREPTGRKVLVITVAMEGDQARVVVAPGATIGE